MAVVAVNYVFFIQGYFSRGIQAGILFFLVGIEHGITWIMIKRKLKEVFEKPFRNLNAIFVFYTTPSSVLLRKVLLLSP